MQELSNVKLLNYGKYRNVYISRDSEGNMYVVKRFYRKELDKQRIYKNVNGFLTSQDWFSDFSRSLKIQLMVQHDRCVRCLHLSGLDPVTMDRESMQDEIDIVMGWCERGSLMHFHNFSTFIPSIPTEVVKCIAHDILEALDYLSTINVAHCDIKPDNIFMDRYGRCKLGDFSQSQLMDDKKHVKGAKGSLYFMAPEMVSGSPGETKIVSNIIKPDPYKGAAIDMWALGISIWILYFREYPFKTLSAAVMELISEISNFDVNEKLTAKKVANQQIEPEFESFISSVVCKDPVKRVTASVALNHQWFDNLDYEKARSYACSIEEDI